MKTWYATKSAGDGQGLVISEPDGANIAVAYDVKDTPLLAAAPDMQAALALCEDILGRASEALERLGDEETRGLVRSAAIEARSALAKAKEQA